MKVLKHIWYSLVIISMWSCEADIELDAPAHDPQIVVEGSISNDGLPFVVLTRTSSFFDETSIQDIEESFVHGANVTVTNGTDTVTLVEYSSDSLPANLVSYIIDSIGVDLPTDSANQVSFYFYTDFSFTMIGTPGTSYWLDVKTTDDHLTSVTTIPQLAGLDTLWWEPHPNADSTHLAILNTVYEDPVSEFNYIRYFVQRNEEPYYTPYFQSAFDDISVGDINGQTIEFSLEPGYDRNADINFDSYLYFNRGDTVTVRWCQIDKAHYNFWYSLEFDRNSTGGIFAQPIVINSNIEGGLGVWGGYGCTEHDIIIPE